jgi:hypothetical protein
MNFQNLRSSQLAIVLMGSAVMAYAGDACKDVRFQFKNQRDQRIRVYKVECFNAANNKTQTESLPNVECASGSTCTTTGDNLRDSEGEDLSNFVFFFNDQEADGGWSNIDVHTQKKAPATKKCSGGMTYKGASTWLIN